MKKILSVILTFVILATSLCLPVESFAADKPKATSISSITAKPAGFTVKYKKVTGVTGYQIQYSTSSKFAKKASKYLKVKKASTISKTVSKLSSKKKYYIRVRTYITASNKTKYSSWSKAKSVTTRHKNEANPTTVKSLTAKQAAFKISWNKISNTIGYQIQYSTSSKFEKKNTTTLKIKKNSTTSKTVKKLKSRKKYYVRIRSYRVVNGKTYYSAWTKSKSVTTRHKNDPDATSLVKYHRRYTEYNHNISKLYFLSDIPDNADGIEYQYCTDKSFPSKLVKSKKYKWNENQNSFKATVSYEKNLYVRVRSYRSIKGKMYYSAWSLIKKVTVDPQSISTIQWNATKDIVDSLNLTDKMSDFEKALIINKWIKNHIFYGEKVKGRTVNQMLSGTDQKISPSGAACGTFARAMQHMCIYSGIDCVCMDTDTHEFNYIKLDGYWYSIEPQAMYTRFEDGIEGTNFEKKPV